VECLLRSFAVEWRPYLIAIMSPILHGIQTPNAIHHVKIRLKFALNLPNVIQRYEDGAVHWMRLPAVRIALVAVDTPLSCFGGAMAIGEP
jgi:hypothetical protein